MNTLSHMPSTVGFTSAHHRDFPSIVLIAASSPCNLKCGACPCTILPAIRDTQSADGRNAPYITFENYKLIAEQCRTHAREGFVPRIRISGYGEPLLNKRLLDMIRYSCGIGVPTSLISNGTYLNRVVAEVLIECDIESVEVSVDAHVREIYDIIRPGGDFDALVKNVSSLVDVRNRRQPDRRTHLIASVVKSPHNHKMIDDIVLFWRNVGVDHVSVRKFLTWGIDSLRATKEALGEESYLAGDAPCPYPYERLMVDPGGWIRLCPYDDQKLIPDFGHVSTVSIADAWTGSRFNKVRACHGQKFDAVRAADNAPLCASCEDRCNRSWNFNYLSIVSKEATKVDAAF